MSLRPPRALATCLLAVMALGLLSSSARAAGADPNACDDPADAPDVVVGDLYEVARYGNVAGITSFAIGTYSCNVGTCWLNWITGNGDNNHPTIGQNMFRLMDGRFEQVGQSWLKHGFFALSNDLCETGCLPTDGEHLGVNCADPYEAALNGQQNRLGPKFEVNATTGFHPHPVTNLRQTGDAIYKRLQVHDVDLDPDLNPGALWFVEGQYVAQDDAAAGNHQNNASYRPIDVLKRPNGELEIALSGSTQVTRPAIQAWQDYDPSVEIVSIDDPDGGRFFVAAKVTDLGAGVHRYEYAIQNLTSHRSANSFTVPVPLGAIVTNVGFHDVDYHSGEPFDLTDWTAVTPQGMVQWRTVGYDIDPDANALRWGTLYNFRFDVDRPPARSLLTAALFRPGLPGQTNALVLPFVAPDACNGNGSCDAGESCFSCPGECGVDQGPDGDGDGVSWCADCNDNDPTRWGSPGETTGLRAARGAAGEVVMTWQAPADAGSIPPSYEVLRSPIASDFTSSIGCIVNADRTAMTASDVDAPTAGSPLYYLVRARSTCDAPNVGTTGSDSFGVPRLAADCP